MFIILKEALKLVMCHQNIKWIDFDLLPKYMIFEAQVINSQPFELTFNE